MPKTSKIDKLIENIYGEYCAGMQLSVMRIPTLFKMARAAIDAGETREQIGELMVAFVNKEKL